MYLKSQLKQLNIIYLGLVAGQVLFAAVVYYLISQGNVEVNNDSIFSFVVPAVAIGNILLSFYIYKFRADQGAKIEGTEDKYSHYKVSNILRWAIVEGANLIALVAALLDGKIYFMLFFVIGLIAFILYRPSLDGFIKDYKVTREEELKIKETMR